MVLSIESEKLKCFFVNSDIEIVDSVNTAKSHFVFTTKKELNNYYPASFLPILSLGEMCLMCKTQKFQSMKNKSGMHNFFLDLLFQMKKYNSENEESLEMFFYLEWILML